MKTKDTETVFELALPHLIKANLIPENPSEKDREWGRKLIALYQKEMSYAAKLFHYQKCSSMKCRNLEKMNKRYYKENKCQN